MLSMTPHGLLVAILAQQALGQQPVPIDVPQSVPADACDPVIRDISSFSIELSSLVDYTGTASQPNEFSRALLSNLKDTSGIFPRLRIGGTTQDRAFYDPDQKEAINSTYEKPDDDQPIRVTYGPGFFDAYHNFGDTGFSHGFNLAYNGSDEDARLADTAAAACSRMGPSTLQLFEIGNEPDFYPTKPNFARPPNWSKSDYVQEWNHKSKILANAIKANCPAQDIGFIAPTFIWTNFTGLPPWNLGEVLKMGLDTTMIKEIALHSYMNTDNEERFGLPTADISMQSLLMNHTSVVGNVAVHLELAQNISYLGLPYTIDETNAMALQGGEMTYSLGNALWTVDFALWCISNNIKRLNFHQGTGYRYSPWQPIEFRGEKESTRPPYYAQMMLAHTIANTTSGTKTRIANIKVPSQIDAAYAIYDNDALARLVALNMETSWSNATASRPNKTFAFHVPEQFGAATVHRLAGPGADSQTNITFGGVSYAYELNGGRPVVVDPEARDERVTVENGVVRVDVPASSAVLLKLVE